MRWLLRRRVDALIVVLTAAELVAVLVSDAPGRLLAGLLVVLSAVALLLRDRAPLLCSVLALALLTGSVLVDGGSPGVQFLGMMMTFAVVAAVTTTRDGVVAGAVGAALIALTAAVTDRGAWVGDATLTIAFCAAMWVAGWLVSRHTRRSDLMAMRARVAEQDRTIAVQDERARIARELHDVVSHGLSVVVLQTAAARAALGDGRADATERHLEAVESTAREALADMRRMLGLLDAEDLQAGESTAPRPGLGELDALFARAEGAGLRIVAAPLPPVDPGPGVGLAAYRVVQECLTNCAKHARNGEVRVTIEASSDTLTIVVTDDGGVGAAPGVDGAGRGLVGMRERVGTYGGTLSAGPLTGRGFRVSATLPLTPADVSAVR